MAETEDKGSRQSLNHILSSPNGETQDTVMTDASLAPETEAAGKSSVATKDAAKESKEEDKSPQDEGKGGSASQIVSHGRRNANGTVGSVYSGNKIRHLKKEDGIPLWRKDIQYAFLRAVFEDETKCFTLEGDDGGSKHSFADIYIHAMARSTKTSKVLREKLLSDRDSATNMAMICLLVNVGRMNTTLNCEYKI
jgi:Ino eighty subunit 1